MALTDRPSFSDLPRRDCVKLLQRNHVGRIAFTFHDRVDIEPISYVFAEDWLYGRTSPGTKLATVRHHPWVAFEVDEIEGRFDWRSVVVHGAMYVLEPDGGDRDREAYAAAVGLLREVDGAALTSGDPTPFRTAIFGIHADDMVGRAASTAR
jgi:nitroimidazol reductase NimA-like FMN-containing flavoprotein (pyridoxamine 5'-phosphate oxidase superfamily)